MSEKMFRFLYFGDFVLNAVVKWERKSIIW